MSTVTEVTAEQLSQPVAGEPTGHLAAGGAVRTSIRDRIASHAAYKSKLVHIEEWGVDIELRSMSLGERNGMITKAKGDAGDQDTDISVIYPELIMRCAHDPETGEKVFAEDDTAFINSLPAELMDKLALPAMAISGMGEKADEDAAKKS